MYLFPVMYRPGFLDVITSFPVLIIMIYMKITDSVASWIVKLPAFRIYILCRLVVSVLHSTPFNSSVSYVSATGDFAHSKCIQGPIDVFHLKIMCCFTFLLLFHSASNSLHVALFQQFEFNEWKPRGVHLDMITCL